MAAAMRATEEQCARTSLHAAAEQAVETFDACRESLSFEIGLLSKGFEPREHADAARRDDVVVKASPE
jgi:hypothetical protein